MLKERLVSRILQTNCLPLRHGSNVRTRLGLVTYNVFRSSHLSTLSKPLPKGTWDSHMHIVEPEKFPLDAQAQYKPQPHSLQDGQKFYSGLGIDNLVIVQPSIYGNDNSCTLNALRELTPRHGRAVVQFDPGTIKQRTLDDWHDLGVRGVRVNLVSVGREVDQGELKRELSQYADVIRRLDWVLDLYIPLKLATVMEKIVPDLDVKVCIDHFGQPSLPEPYDPGKAIDPYALEGFQSLVNLLQGNTWVKMSGQYRISKDPELRDLDAMGRELLKAASDRVVYATDWPHTRFENIDSVPFIEACYRWCGAGTGLAEKLFVTNAEELWDVPPSA